VAECWVGGTHWALLVRYVIAVWDVVREWDDEHMGIQQHSLWETAFVMVVAMALRYLMDAFDPKRQITKGMTLETYNRLLQSLGRQASMKRLSKANITLHPVLLHMLQVFYAPIRLIPSIWMAYVATVPPGLSHVHAAELFRVLRLPRGQVCCGVERDQRARLIVRVVMW